KGYRGDLARLGSEWRRRGVIFVIDASQSAGVLRLDFDSLPVDFVSAVACKWLLGPRGIGLCYCRPELLGRMRDTAPRFEESSLSVLDTAAFRAAVELLLELGPDRVEQQVLSLTRRLADGLAERG